MNNRKPRVLLVDDDREIQTLLQATLSNDYDFKSFTSPLEALRMVEQAEAAGTLPNTFDVVLSDLKMPEMDGLQFVERLRKAKCDVPVIMITAHGTIESAVDAMKAGAHDFLLKPFNIDDVRNTLARTVEFRSLTYGSLYDRNPKNRPPGLIGQSSKMLEIFNLIRRISSVDSTVLITGESGSGKEMIAQAIHDSGRRRFKKFVAINCAAIPQDLLESELFGHVRGSFTGATAEKKGLFEVAEGGTILLDEIGDMPISLQAKLLRVLQERKIRPVGSNLAKDLDVRIIAATHQDLRMLCHQGKFREDLFYRLSVIPLLVPSLRERVADIPALAEHFLKKARNKAPISVEGFSPEAMQKLQGHTWRGNVRELENAVERAAVLSPHKLVSVDDFKFLDDSTSMRAADSTAAEIGGPIVESAKPAAPKEMTLNLREMEKEALIAALEKTGGRKEKAAEILGISRKTLYRKEKEYGLSPL